MNLAESNEANNGDQLQTGYELDDDDRRFLSLLATEPEPADEEPITVPARNVDDDLPHL
jgi:hypothetical protein